MTENTQSRGPQRGRPFVVRTIDLLKHPKPAHYANLSYTISRPTPVEDPTAYAASCLHGNGHAKMVFRLPAPLEATHSETQASLHGRAPRRSDQGDPALALAQQDRLDEFAMSMMVAGVPALQYQARQAARTLATAKPSTSLSLETPDTTLVTPQKRGLGGLSTSTAKRQRTVRASSDEDVSMVQSVLRMVDDSLVDTPERKPAATPRVLRAAPGPSPRQHGPTYAYGAQDRVGFVPRAQAGAAGAAGAAWPGHFARV